MRLSFILLLFLVLFNGWAGMLQTYDIDDHLGISAETGDASELDQAEESAQEVQTGGAVGSTLLGFYNALLSVVRGLIVGIQPGAQLLINILPAGPAEDMVTWAFGIVPFIIAFDFISIARGVDL